MRGLWYRSKRVPVTRTYKPRAGTCSLFGFKSYLILNVSSDHKSALVMLRSLFSFCTRPPPSRRQCVKVMGFKRGQSYSNTPRLSPRIVFNVALPQTDREKKLHIRQLLSPNRYLRLSSTTYHPRHRNRTHRIHLNPESLVQNAETRSTVSPSSADQAPFLSLWRRSQAPYHRTRKSLCF